MPLERSRLFCDLQSGLPSVKEFIPLLGRGRDIFLDDVDRQDFLKTLAEACLKTGFQVHAHCLMRNHLGRS